MFSTHRNTVWQAKDHRIRLDTDSKGLWLLWVNKGVINEILLYTVPQQLINATGLVLFYDRGRSTALVGEPPTQAVLIIRRAVEAGKEKAHFTFKVDGQSDVDFVLDLDEARRFSDVVRHHWNVA